MCLLRYGREQSTARIGNDTTAGEGSRQPDVAATVSIQRSVRPKPRPTLQRKIQQLREAGVVMLIGTDSGVPLTFHTDSTWREIDYWVGTFGFDA